MSKFIALINLPGIVMHEMSHKFFCDWAKVKVFKVCYFRFGNPAGYVVHETPGKFTQSFFISMGPLIVGTIISGLFFVLYQNNHASVVRYVYLWLGITIAAQSLPSIGDAKNLWLEAAKHFWRNPLAFIGFPISGVIWVFNKLNFFYAKYLFALGWFWLVTVYVK
jgi:hypothetical protein